MELVWVGGIKSQIKRKVNSKLWDLCQLCSLFYWSVACGAFQGVCPSGVLPSTCYPLEQGNGLLKICSLPQPAPSPMPCGMSQCDLGAGLGSAAGTQSLCPRRGLPLGPNMSCLLRTRPTWLPHPPGSFPKSFTLFHSPNIANKGKAFCF